MIFLALLSIYAIETKKSPLLAGALMGLAISIKIVPVIFLPAVVLYLPGLRDRIRFVGSLSAAFLVCSLPYILLDPVLMLRTIFTYGSVQGTWGLSRITLLFDNDPRFGWIYTSFKSYGKTILIVSVLSISVALHRSRVRLPLFAQCGLITALFLFLTPGFGLQYLSWLVPWVVCLTPFAAAAYYTAAGVFMAVVYTHWSGGFPLVFRKFSRGAGLVRVCRVLGSDLLAHNRPSAQRVHGNVDDAIQKGVCLQTSRGASDRGFACGPA